MQENENNRQPDDATESTSGRWGKILEIISIAIVAIFGIYYYNTQGNGFYRKIYNMGVECIQDDFSGVPGVKVGKFKKDYVDVLSPETVDCTYGQLRHDVYKVTVPTEWDRDSGEHVSRYMEVTIYLYQDDSSDIPGHYHTESLVGQLEKAKKAIEDMEQGLDDAYDEFEDNFQDELDSYQDELQEELQENLQEGYDSW